MQFEKEEVGYCRKLSGVRESGLFAERKGGKGEYQSWKMEVNIGVVNVGSIKTRLTAKETVLHICLALYFFKKLKESISNPFEES